MAQSYYKIETEIHKPGIDFIDCVELNKSLLTGI